MLSQKNKVRTAVAASPPRGVALLLVVLVGIVWVVFAAFLMILVFITEEKGVSNDDDNDNDNDNDDDDDDDDDEMCFKSGFIVNAISAASSE